VVRKSSGGIDLQKVRETLVLLLLGTSMSKSHSMVQIQKEFFYLWRSSEKIKPLIRFIAHYRGPYSEALNDSIRYPKYLEYLWDFVPPRKNDTLTGGLIILNDEGQREFNNIIQRIKKANNIEMIQLISAMRLLHDLYDDLSVEEFLYMVYINPDNIDFIIKSEIYDKIINKNVKSRLSKRLNIH